MYLCSGKVISAIIPRRWRPSNVSLLDLRVSLPPCKFFQQSVFYSYCTLFLVSSHFSRGNVTTKTLSCTYALRKINPKLCLEGNESRIGTEAVQIHAAAVCERCLVFRNHTFPPAESNSNSHNKWNVKESPSWPVVSLQHFKRSGFQLGGESLFPHLHHSTEGSHSAAVTAQFIYIDGE